MNIAFVKTKRIAGPWRTGLYQRLLTLFMVVLVTSAVAQTPVQVVTKVVDKEFAYVDGQRIRLTAQKADVTLKGWNRPTVSIRLRLVAKHPDKAIAEREVAYHQYIMQASGNELVLSNRVVIPQRVGEIQSQLKAVYDVNLPAKALVQLTNSFGDVRLSDLSGDVTLRFEFGRLTLDDISGKLTITSDYGDIEGRNVNAVLVCKAEKADISLRDLGGSSRIQSRYGKLTVVPNAATLNALYVEAARTEILFAPRRLADFRYDVITTFADIRVPESVVGELGRYGSKQTFTYQPPGARKPEIQIQTSYSPVVIQGEKPIVDR